MRAVLTQAAKMRTAGAISEKTFTAQMERLKCEELKPRGLSLRVDEHFDGTFSITVENKARECVYGIPAERQAVRIEDAPQPMLLMGSLMAGAV